MVITSRLRCNREKPCQNCTTRNEVSNCQYTVSRMNASPTEYPYKQSNPMQQRIDHLEDLVKSLIAQHQDISVQDRGTASGPTPEVSSSSSVISEGDTHTTIVDGVHSVYKGKADWYEVLQEVCRRHSPR
jgi:CCR4-NOT transcriptional regulation complex NOT5 subunit